MSFFTVQKKQLIKRQRGTCFGVFRDRRGHRCFILCLERERDATMAIASDCHRLSRVCRLCFPFILLFQLAWILPSTLFLVIQTPTPRIFLLQDQNASRRINSLGFAGPVKVFGDGELTALKKIYDEWSSFWPAMRENLMAKGFVQPAERTCFIWLPECYLLAKHERIVQIIKEAIGPKVLLYGMTVWKGKNEALQRFHRDAVVAGCEKSLNFVSGTNLQLISQSHKIPERLLQAVLTNLMRVEEASFTIASNKQEELAFLERSFAARVKRMIKTADVRLENLEGKDGYGVFFHGGTLYRIGEALGDRRGLLLQFISADCKVRDPPNYAWGSQGTSHSLYMPPVLLVAGDRLGLGASNDVRLTLAKDEAIGSKIGDGKKVLGSLLASVSNLTSVNDKALQVHNVTVFPEPNVTLAWQEEEIWRFQKVGEVSTTVMAHGRIDHFLLAKRMLAMDFSMVAGDGEQVIVVLREGMLYFRAVDDGELPYCELLELRPGSAVLLSRKLLHALMPLGRETAFISFRWGGYGNEKLLGKPRSNDHTKILHFGDDNPLDKLLGYNFIQATEGRTITLSKGQAYDPDNNENCDVIIFVVEGYFLQILPSNATLQAPDVLLIPADQSCVLWNIGGLPVKFFAMHVCRLEDAMQIATAFGASGKIF